jgi:hypothetical protein
MAFHCGISHARRQSNTFCGKPQGCLAGEHIPVYKSGKKIRIFTAKAKKCNKFLSPVVRAGKFYARKRGRLLLTKVQGWSLAFNSA